MCGSPAPGRAGESSSVSTWQTWQTVSGSLSGVSGAHDVYLVFDGTTSIGNVNWFRFR